MEFTKQDIIDYRKLRGEFRTISDKMDEMYQNYDNGFDMLAYKQLALELGKIMEKLIPYAEKLTIATRTHVESLSTGKFENVFKVTRIEWDVWVRRNEKYRVSNFWDGPSNIGYLVYESDNLKHVMTYNTLLGEVYTDMTEFLDKKVANKWFSFRMPMQEGNISADDMNHAITKLVTRDTPIPNDSIRHIELVIKAGKDSLK